jgi:hypothetical protein
MQITPALHTFVALVDINDEEVIGDDTVAQPVPIIEPRSNDTLVRGRVEKSVRNQIGYGMFAG